MASRLTSNIPSRRRPPRTPWAATLSLVGVSAVPRMLCRPTTMMGTMATSWETQRTQRSCQELTSGMYFTITLLEVKHSPARMAQHSPSQTKGAGALLGSVLLAPRLSLLTYSASLSTSLLQLRGSSTQLRLSSGRGTTSSPT